jgi:hypothetical protein
VHRDDPRQPGPGRRPRRARARSDGADAEALASGHGPRTGKLRGHDLQAPGRRRGKAGSKGAQRGPARRQGLDRHCLADSPTPRQHWQSEQACRHAVIVAARRGSPEPLLLSWIPAASAIACLPDKWSQAWRATYRPVRRLSVNATLARANPFPLPARLSAA